MDMDSRRYGSINEYECTAVNVIDGHFMSVTHKVKFNVTGKSRISQLKFDKMHIIAI